MYCNKCGEKLEEGWSFCPNCNSKVVLEKTLKTEEDAKSKKTFNIFLVILCFILFIGSLVCSVIFNSYFWIFFIVASFVLVYALVVHFRYLITKIMLFIFICFFGATCSVISLVILFLIDSLSTISC